MRMIAAMINIVIRNLRYYKMFSLSPHDQRKHFLISNLLFARLGHGKLKFCNEGMSDLKGIFEL